jgi:Domain of unknown function (DUF305)
VFIDSMNTHHRSAIEMAEVAARETANPEMKGLAINIVGRRNARSRRRSNGAGIGTHEVKTSRPSGPDDPKTVPGPGLYKYPLGVYSVPGGRRREE